MREVKRTRREEKRGEEEREEKEKRPKSAETKGIQQGLALGEPWLERTPLVVDHQHGHLATIDIQ